MVELVLSDALTPPGARGGQRLNASRVWARNNNGPWVVTRFRSLTKARMFVAGYGSESLAFRNLTDEEE